MPNLFAYVVLFSFPFLVVYLFRRLPLRLALIWVIFGGYMALPDRAGFNLRAIPDVDKDLLPSVMAFAMCAIAAMEARRRIRLSRAGGMTQVDIRAKSDSGFVSARTRPAVERDAGASDVKTRRSPWITALFYVCLLGPILTMVTNREPLFYSSTMLRALSPQDAWGTVQSTLVMLLPFVLGRKYLTTADSHMMILRVMCQMALVMSLAILVEVRLSPQLNVWIYGFQGSSFSQHIRAGGFRPMLFLQHGLWVGVIIAMSVIAALTLYRSSTGRARWMWLAVSVWLFITLVLSKTIGALALCILMATVVLFVPKRGKLVVAAVLAGAVAIYPTLRSAGVVPVMQVYELAASFSSERASSLLFRLVNEDQLLARASEKPLTGWGGWDRAAIYDSLTGEKLSIADGSWVIAIGTGGWVGYIGLFGLLCLPLVILAIRRRDDMTNVTAGLLLMLALNIVDLIPNATLTPITWLMAGAVAGFYENGNRRAVPAASRAALRIRGT